jgi:hypothetical protein
MYSKRILSATLFSVMITLLSCVNQPTADLVIPETCFVPVIRFDNKTYYCLFQDLNLITPYVFEDSSVGQTDRIDFVKGKRKLTLIEFEKIKKRGEIYDVPEPVDSSMEIKKYIYGNDKLSFMSIPDSEKGLVLHCLWKQNFYVNYGEYEGIYLLIPQK